MMSDFDYDLFVIGAGSGGVRAARIAANHGAKVAVAEEHRVGGTCVIRGCVPKKMLVYGAHFAEDLHDAARFGWSVQAASFDWKTLRDNVLADVDRLNGLYTQNLTNNAVTIIHERAVIEAPHEIRLASGQMIRARIILVATGATPVIPDVEGKELGITSNEAFHLDKLPQRVLISGAGYIANEFAGIFNAFGCDVTLMNRSDVILRSYDEALRDRLMQISRTKGIKYRFNAQFERICRNADGSLHVEMSGHDAMDVDCVMFAIGRRPNIDGLGLDAVGVQCSKSGAILVDERNRTNIDSIYAIGDVTDRVQLTPVAIREGQAFADTVFGNDPHTVDYDAIPSAVFSDPPIAAVGLTEAEARATLPSVKIYQSDFRAMKNVLAGREERSLYKMVCDGETGKVVGLHLIGPDAPEVLQAAAIAVKAGLTKRDFDNTVALHPSMAEELVLMR